MPEPDSDGHRAEKRGVGERLAPSRSAPGRDISRPLAKYRGDCGGGAARARLWAPMDAERGMNRDFESFLAEVSTRFTGIPAAEVDAEIERALHDLCEVLGTDRATFAEFAADGESFRPTHSWARSPTRPFSTPLIRTEIPWLYHQLLRGQTVRLERLPDEVPVEASQDRESMRRAGMKSVLSIPIAVGGRFVCGLSTGAFRTHCAWSDATVARVRTVGQILANGLYRRQAEAELGARLAAIEELKGRLEAENVYLRDEATPTQGFEQVVGRSRAMRAALERAVKVADTSTTVLLLGETGTGKEILARGDPSAERARHRIAREGQLRRAAPDADRERAVRPREGRVHRRDRRARRVASSWPTAARCSSTRSATCRWSCSPSSCACCRRASSSAWAARALTRSTSASSRRPIATFLGPLPRARFREDLYYRLGVFPILLPPLRDRREDIPLLVWAIIERLQPRLGRRISRVPRPVMDRLVSYPWPGNVRELQNVVERALILSPGPVLQVEETLDTAGPRRADRLDEVEREHILHVLKRCDWRVDGPENAAATLGLNASTLRSRMQKLGIGRPEPSRPRPHLTPSPFRPRG